MGGTYRQGPKNNLNITSMNGGFLYFDPANGLVQSLILPNLDMSRGADISFFAITDTINSYVSLSLTMTASNSDTSQLLTVNAYNAPGVFPTSWTKFSASIPPINASAILSLMYTSAGASSRPMAIDTLVITTRSCPPTSSTTFNLTTAKNVTIPGLPSVMFNLPIITGGVASIQVASPDISGYSDPSILTGKLLLQNISFVMTIQVYGMVNFSEISPILIFLAFGRPHFVSLPNYF